MGRQPARSEATTDKQTNKDIVRVIQLWDNLKIGSMMAANQHVTAAVVELLRSTHNEAIEKCLGVVTYARVVADWDARGNSGVPDWNTVAGTLLVLRKAIRALKEGGE